MQRKDLLQRPEQLSSQRVLVTGASAGLGAQLALAFAAEGATVAMVARRRRRLQALCQKVEKRGGNAHMITADLSREKDVLRLCQELQMRFGGIDILLNNAAVYQEQTQIIKTTDREWESILNTNLRAPFLLSREFLPGMLRRGYGRIVNILSATNDVEGQAPYRISKIGLEVLTAGLAAELTRRKVAVVGVNPGWMRTEMSISGRHPSGAARAIVKLVTWDPRRLNGKIIDLIWAGNKYDPTCRLRNRGMFG